MILANYTGDTGSSGCGGPFNHRIGPVYYVGGAGSSLGGQSGNFLAFNTNNPVGLTGPRNVPENGYLFNKTFTTVPGRRYRIKWRVGNAAGTCDGQFAGGTGIATQHSFTRLS